MKRNTMSKYLSVNDGYSSSESVSFKWFITLWRDKFILNINITKNTLAEKFDGLTDRECFFIKYVKFSGNMKQKHLLGFDSKKEIFDYIAVLKSNPLEHYSSGHYVVKITGMPRS